MYRSTHCSVCSFMSYTHALTGPLKEPIFFAKEGSAFDWVDGPVSASVTILFLEKALDGWCTGSVDPLTEDDLGASVKT